MDSPLAKVLVVLVGVVMLAAMCDRESAPKPPPPPPPTAAQLAAKAAEDRRFQKAVFAARIVRAGLKDPESVQWDVIMVNDDATTVCVAIKARNSFNAVVPQHVVFVKEVPSTEVAQWNKHCAGKSMHNMTNARRAL